MKIVQLKDDLSDYDFGYITNKDDLVWLVTHYTADAYEGSGDAVGFDGKQFYVWNLSHCSCYGPMEGGPEEVSWELFYDTLDNVQSPIPDSCLHEVKQLLVQAGYTI